MTANSRTPAHAWTRNQASLLAVLCLLAGIAGGWSIRASQAPSSSGAAAPAASISSTAVDPLPSAASIKAAVDAQAAPLLEKLKADPENPDLLISLGNFYYDAHQYQSAIDYYQRTLKVKPADASVRTDMGTAYWYIGNADTAISEFDKALTFVPNNPNTLFNRGLVRWRGKHDSAGALADLEKLLATSPNYEQKDQVEQLLAEVKQSSSTESTAKPK